MSQHNEDGFSLIEVAMSMVLIGGAIAALATALLNASVSSQSHRDLTVLDSVLRNYAEAVKAGVRQGCSGAAATFTVTYTPPTGYTVVSPTSCPPAGATLDIPISATVVRTGVSQALTIAVRRP